MIRLELKAEPGAPHHGLRLPSGDRPRRRARQDAVANLHAWKANTLEAMARQLAG